MSGQVINCGFVPLVDCAPLVIAREIGFAAEEGLDLVLHCEPTWSSVRDKLIFGQFDAAHMLSPVPVASSIGLGGIPKRLDVLSVLSVNGNVIGVSRALHQRMKDLGTPLDFQSAGPIGTGLINAQRGPLRIGVPFPFSMHAELLYHWLGTLGLEAPSALEVRTVPPAKMAEALAAGEIDAFCVGEPWGSVTASRAGGVLILPSKAIWSFSPEKVLTVRHDWVDLNKDLAHALLRATWRAAQWMSDQNNLASASEILAHKAYVNVNSEVIEAALTGHVGVGANGISHHSERFIEFFDSAATFPWKSQAGWIANRLASRMGLARKEAIDIGRASFRTDVYRHALSPIGVDLPGASEKVEGALSDPTAVSSSRGQMILGPDRFFDGQVFDPRQI